MKVVLQSPLNFRFALGAARSKSWLHRPLRSQFRTEPEFTVLTTDEISSKTATEGDPLSFKVAEDVVINNKVVIAKDSLVKGTVASVKKSGFFGRGGNLGIRIESAVTVDSQKVKLRSAKNKEGGDKTGTTVALVVLFGPLGFLKKGKNAIIKPGTQIKVFTDEDKKVQPKA